MAEGTLNPRDAKLRMARDIVAQFHNVEAAQEAQEAFLRQFSQRRLPTDIPDYQLSEPTNIINLIVDAKLSPSKNEARRLVKQGGVSFFPKGEAGEAERITDNDYIVPILDGAVLKVGKLQYIRIRA